MKNLIQQRIRDLKILSFLLKTLAEEVLIREEIAFLESLLVELDSKKWEPEHK